MSDDEEPTRASTLADDDGGASGVDYIPYGALGILELRGGGRRSPERGTEEHLPVPKVEPTHRATRGGPDTSHDMTDHHRGVCGPPVVMGHQGERRVIVCNGCHSDQAVRDSGWTWCRCGAARCARCMHEPCSWCARGVQALDVPVFGDEGPRGDDDMSKLRLGDLPVHAFGDVAASAPSQPREGADRHCVRCSARLGYEGAAWRICRCEAGCCLSCSRYECPKCSRSIMGDTTEANIEGADPLPPPPPPPTHTPRDSRPR